MATVTFETNTGKPLPKIGPAARHALIPTTGAPYVDPEWNRLSAIRIQGSGLTADLAASVTSASMSFSSSQVGQLSMVFADSEDGQVLRSGIIQPKSTMDYRNQHLEIRGIDVAAGVGGPQITVKARSRVIGVLTGKEHRGLGSWGEQDVTQWIKDRCKEAGATARVQGKFGKMLFTRTAADDTTWAMMQRAAGNVGAWCFEFENIVTFMQPTALAAKGRARWWDLNYMSPSDYTHGLTGQPSYSWSADSGGETLSFGLLSGDADLIRPGDRVSYHGRVGPAHGDWIVTQTDHPLRITEAVSVGCVRIINPEKQATG